MSIYPYFTTFTYIDPLTTYMGCVDTCNVPKIYKSLRNWATFIRKYLFSLVQLATKIYQLVSMRACEAACAVRMCAYVPAYVLASMCMRSFPFVPQSAWVQALRPE